MKKLKDMFMGLVGLLWYPNLSRKLEEVDGSSQA